MTDSRGVTSLREPVIGDPPNLWARVDIYEQVHDSPFEDVSTAQAGTGQDTLKSLILTLCSRFPASASFAAKGCLLPPQAVQIPKGVSHGSS